MLLPLGILASASGGADYELISTTVLGSSQAQVDFSVSAFSGVYKHLQLRMVYASNTGGNGTYIRGRFNSDSGSNYAYHVLYGQGSSALSTGGATQNAMVFSPMSGTGSSTQPDAVIADFLDPFSTSKNKTTRLMAGHATGSINLISGAWFSTSAVTAINLLAYSQGSASTFGAGSRFSLYGLKG
jgi:hypothetical protein